ncbi:hypothetical protein GIB67_009615 [Kingdonia uniflora]|uniref:TFIIE beta domain-containing protein n=1 Tax=Kingdonia uniflora TaxID=39325 RepID=A0A7J7M299_9MAGN|nr:hypothetical protein GIB67_009615 [Kingdonia uniflora]
MNEEESTELHSRAEEETELTQLMQGVTTHDPVPVVHLDDSTWIKLGIKWKNAIAFKSISPEIKEQVIMDGVTRAWAKLIPRIPPFSFEKGSKIFIANFDNPRDLQIILNSQPVNVFGFSILQQRFNPMLHQSEISFTKFLCWVQISGLPCCMLSKEMIRLIGNKIEEYVSDDWVGNSTENIRGSFVRIQVNLFTEKPLVLTIPILRPAQLKEARITVCYERLERFCPYCGVPTHTFSACKRVEKLRHERNRLNINDNYKSCLKLVLPVSSIFPFLFSVTRTSQLDRGRPPGFRQNKGGFYNEKLRDLNRRKPPNTGSTQPGGNDYWNTGHEDERSQDGYDSSRAADSEVAEAVAVIRGMEAALGRGMERVMVFTDCRRLVGAFETGSTDLSWGALTLAPEMFLAGRFHEFRFQFINRSFNFEAHALAALGACSPVTMALEAQLAKFNQQQERCQTTLTTIPRPGNSQKVTSATKPAIKFSSDTERLQEINLIQRSPVGAQIKKVIDVLFKTRGNLTAQQIYDECYVDVRRNKDVFNSLAQNVKVFYDGMRFSYKSKHDVKDKSQLLVLIRKFPEGIPVIDLKDSYPTIVEDLQALKSAGQIWLLSNFDSQEDIAYPNDPRIQGKVKVDDDLKVFFREIELPRDMIDIEKDLQKNGMKPATNTANRRSLAQVHGISPKTKPKKKQRQVTNRTKLTNSHLPELFRE